MPTVKIKRIILLIWLLYLSSQNGFSQPYSSKDNYTGAWESPASWIPEWTVPLNDVNGINITINGYITIDNSLIFKGSANTLTINDTLVVKGNLTLENNNDITINDNGILIVMGNLLINNSTDIVVNGYLVVTGNVSKNGSSGTITSNDDPVKVYISGTIPAALTTDTLQYPALNCTDTLTIHYPNSSCSYGNGIDLETDSIINNFLENTCAETNVYSEISLCVGNTINLSSSLGTSYSWVGPNGFISTLQNPSINDADSTMSGDYIITVTAGTGCIDIDTIKVTVNYTLPATPTITASGPTAFCSGEV